MVTTVSSHGRVNGCFHNTLRVTQNKSPAFQRGSFRAEGFTEQLGNEAGKYCHAITHGLLADDRDQMADAMARRELPGRVHQIPSKEIFLPHIPGFGPFKNLRPERFFLFKIVQ